MKIDTDEHLFQLLILGSKEEETAGRRGELPLSRPTFQSAATLIGKQPRGIKM